MTEVTTRTLPRTVGLRRDHMLEPDDGEAHAAERQAEAEGAWLGRMSDCRGAWMLAIDGAAMAEGRRLAQAFAAFPPEGTGRAGDMACGPLPPSCR